MSGDDEGKPGADRPDAPASSQDMADVLASIRELVSAEADARKGGGTSRMPVPVLMLTPQMRVDASGPSGEVLAEGLEDVPARAGAAAPILDEEALRGVVNAIVREELQGEMGDRISRNLRKLVRREIALVLREERESAETTGA